MNLRSTINTLGKCKSLQRSPTFVKLFSNESENTINDKNERVNIHWIRKDGSLFTTPSKLGTNLLRLAQRYDLEIEKVYVPAPHVTAFSSQRCMTTYQNPARRRKTC